MQVARVKRFRLQDGNEVAVAILEGLVEIPKLVTVLARRDLIHLQKIFADIEAGRPAFIAKYQRLITKMLDEVTNERDTTTARGDRRAPLRDSRGLRTKTPVQGVGSKARQNGCSIRAKTGS